MVEKPEISDAYEAGFEEGYRVGFEDCKRAEALKKQGAAGLFVQPASPKARAEVARSRTLRRGWTGRDDTNHRRLLEFLEQNPGSAYGEIKDALGFSAAQKAYRFPAEIVRTEDGRFWLHGRQPEGLPLAKPGFKKKKKKILEDA